MARLPLEGVRVVDITVVWAGPFATQLLAEWGAEVIRLEPLTAVQPQTRGVERARFLTRESVERAAKLGTSGGGYPNRDPLPDPWNRNAMFNASSSNKLSFTGNMARPSGQEAFRRLVAVSDVVVENNVPSTGDKIGLSYEYLRAINPAIILVRMPGFGLSGAYAGYRCWGNHLEGMAGHHLVRSYPELTLDAAGETYACDSIAGLTAALGAVMALRHRARSGRGQQVEVPQIEAFVQMMGTEILDYTLNGRVASAMGNEHRSHAPHGVYPCKPGGPWLDESSSASESPQGRVSQTFNENDRWIAIDAATDEQWRALCRVVDAPELAADPRYQTAGDRWHNRRDLDRAIGELTRAWDQMALFHALQAEGVPAGPVQDDGDCFRCPQLEARGFFQEQTRDDIGTHRYPGMLFQWQDTPNRHRRPPPKLGQDNEYVYRELLGYSTQEYERLVDAGEVGTSYPDWLVQRAGE